MKIVANIIVILILLVGCSTPVKVMRYTTEVFKPTEQLEVLRTKPIARDYIEIGEVSIRLKKSTESNAVALLVEKAKELGADAIILMGERSRGAVAMPVGSMLTAIPLRELYGIAIKYK